MLFTNSLKFDTSSWKLLEKSQRIALKIKSDNCLLWKNELLDILSLYFFPLPPENPAPALNSLGDLRDYYRDSIQQVGGGLVSVDQLSISGAIAVKTIFKFPQNPHGMVYVGSLTFPLVDCSYVIKVQCQEYGTTGMRDAVIFALNHHCLPIEVDESQRVKGWFQDPYDSERQDPIMRNLSEDEKYDADFPTHPLSRVRRYLHEIQDSLEFSHEFFQPAICEQDLCR